MMCQSIGLPPISTIGLGRTAVSSLSREPKPPARITAFTAVQVIPRPRCTPAVAGAPAATSAKSEEGLGWPSVLEHAHDVRRPCRERVVGLGFREHPKPLVRRARELERVARVEGAAMTGGADHVELDPRAARRARVEHELLALGGDRHAEQAPAEEDRA